MQPAKTISCPHAASRHQFPLAGGNPVSEPEDEDLILRRRDLCIRCAATPANRRQADQLIQRMYAWRGYRCSGSTGVPARPDQTVLRALCGPETVGTLTLGLDSAAGLLADRLYGPEVAGLRHPERRLCELTGLAVAPGGPSREVLAALFQAAYLLGRGRHRVSDVVIEVNPRHVAYYERCLGFRQAGPLRHCPRVEAPAVLLHLRLTMPELHLPGTPLLSQ